MSKYNDGFKQNQECAVAGRWTVDWKSTDDGTIRVSSGARLGSPCMPHCKVKRCVSKNL